MRTRFANNENISFAVRNSGGDYNIRLSGTAKADSSSVVVVSDRPCFNDSFCSQIKYEYPITSFNNTNILINMSRLNIRSDSVFFTLRNALPENENLSFGMRVTDVHREVVGQQHQEVIEPLQY